VQAANWLEKVDMTRMNLEGSVLACSVPRSGQGDPLPDSADPLLAPATGETLSAPRGPRFPSGSSDPLIAFPRPHSTRISP